MPTKELWESDLAPADPHGLDAVEGPTPLVERGDGVIRSRVNKVQKMLRVQKVANWLLEGRGYAEIVTLCMDKWKISKNTAARYYADGKEQIEAANAGELKSATVTALYRLTELYSAAVDKEDFKTALEVVKVQARMLGLNAPDRIEKRDVENWDSMDVAEQLKRVSGIIERAQDKSRSLN